MSELWKQAWEPRLALARAALGTAGKSLNSSQPSWVTKGLLRAENPAMVHGSTPLCLCLPHHVRAPYGWPVLHGMHGVHRPRQASWVLLLTMHRSVNPSPVGTGKVKLQVWVPPPRPPSL